jgi:hypothetical protein
VPRDFYEKGAVFRDENAARLLAQSGEKVRLNAEIAIASGTTHHLPYFHFMWVAQPGQTPTP